MTRAQRAIAIIDRLTHTKGPFAQQLFQLRPWQKRILQQLFKTRPDGRRQYRTCLLMLPRKNGKSELAAALAKLCELEWTAREASAQKSQPGFSIFLHTTMVDSAGNEHQNVKVHPAIRIEGELWPFYDYFGMTPSGRARLRVPKAPEAPASKWAGELK